MCCCARGRRARRRHRGAAPRDRWESPAHREGARPRERRPGEGRAGREAERAEKRREEEVARHAEVPVWPAARSRVTAARPRHSPCAATRDPLRPGARPPPWAVERSEEHSLNSSHGYISYAVFCLKKKKQE